MENDEDEQLGYEGRYKKLAPAVTETHDLPKIARIVIGKDTCTARVSLWVRGNWFDKQSDMVGTENGYEPVVFYCVREFFRWKIIGTHWPDRKPGIPEL